MMKTSMKRLDLIVNISIVSMAIVLIIALVNRFVSPEKSAGTGDSVTSVKLPLEGVDWARNRRTLILALTVDCSYCQESAAFYETVSDQLRRTGNGQFMAVFPNWSKAGEEYLKQLGISASEIRHEPFNLIGVTGTPTLILVSDAGIVMNKWVGKLRPDQEAEVLDRLQLGGDLVAQISRRPPVEAGIPADLIEPASLKQEVDLGGGLIVVDTRSREEFAQGHIPSSRNIPVDELEVRAINELPRSGGVVIYCDTPDEDTSRFASLILSEQKFGRVLVLHGGLMGWRKAGLPVTTR